MTLDCTAENDRLPIADGPALPRRRHAMLTVWLLAAACKPHNARTGMEHIY